MDDVVGVFPIKLPNNAECARKILYLIVSLGNAKAMFY